MVSQQEAVSASLVLGGGLQSLHAGFTLCERWLHLHKHIALD